LDGYGVRRCLTHGDQLSEALDGRLMCPAGHFVASPGGLLRQGERAVGRYYVTVVKLHPTGSYVGYEDRTELVEAMRDERDRYREALERIAGWELEIRPAVRDVAREALDG
jgi:hypothetical protein